MTKKHFILGLCLVSKILAPSFVWSQERVQPLPDSPTLPAPRPSNNLPSNNLPGGNPRLDGNPRTDGPRVDGPRFDGPRIDGLPVPRLPDFRMDADPKFDRLPLGKAVLTLDDILVSIDRHYPLIRAVEQERVMAQGKLLSSEGVFDLGLKGFNDGNTGTYNNNQFNFGFDQFLGTNGATLTGGYRQSIGAFPIYYGNLLTGDGGEFRAGLNVPLLRDREIDRKRAQLKQAGLDRANAEPLVQVQRIDVSRAGSRAFWVWVAAAQRLIVAQDILDTAKKRIVQIQEMADAGKLPKIEVTDNMRIINDREARLISSGRFYQQAAISLSLYLRSPGGEPLLPHPSQVPVLPDPMEPPDARQRAGDLDLAYRQRPELKRLAINREKAIVDLSVAENMMMPGVNFVVSGAQNVGSGDPKLLNRSAYDAGLVVDVPLQRRDAKGRALTARAGITQTYAQEQFARDRILNEIADALSALERAHDLKIKALENLRLAEKMVKAETELFELGKSDLFRVNIRELQYVEARFILIDAVAESLRALADYLAALGTDPSCLAGENTSAPEAGPDGEVRPNPMGAMEKELPQPKER